MRNLLSRMLLGIAELFGRMLGYATRTGLGWSLLELVGAGCIVLGVGRWSLELGLIVLGMLCITVSWVHSRKRR